MSNAIDWFYCGGVNKLMKPLAWLLSIVLSGCMSPMEARLDAVRESVARDMGLAPSEVRGKAYAYLPWSGDWLASKSAIMPAYMQRCAEFSGKVLEKLKIEGLDGRIITYTPYRASWNWQAGEQWKHAVVVSNGWVIDSAESRVYQSYTGAVK